MANLFLASWTIKDALSISRLSSSIGAGKFIAYRASTTSSASCSSSSTCSTICSSSVSIATPSTAIFHDEQIMPGMSTSTVTMSVVNNTMVAHMPMVDNTHRCPNYYSSWLNQSTCCKRRLQTGQGGGSAELHMGVTKRVVLCLVVELLGGLVVCVLLLVVLIPKDNG